MEAVPH